MIRPNRFIGRYEIAAELGEGGMATVLLARLSGPAGFQRLCAVKVIRPTVGRDPAFVEMFLDEARIASRIHHPNVCSVFDFGESDGVHFLAMEYLNGEPLHAVLSAMRRERTAAQARREHFFSARLIADACEGLHAAHELRDEQGKLLDVVHRDVSPHNLFVTFDGACRVVDFGIARAADRIHKTASGIVRGKVSYMSPEQLEGRPVDRRTDVWALGVTLWELLAGRRLFKRETPPQTIAAVLGGPIVHPSAYEPTISAELDAIVLRALARDPEERYPTAREMGRELGRVIAASGTPVGMAETAEWLDELFPGARERKRRLMDDAKTGIVAANVTAQADPARRPAGLPDAPDDQNGPDVTADARPRRAPKMEPAVVAAAAAVAGEDDDPNARTFEDPARRSFEDASARTFEDPDPPRFDDVPVVGAAVPAGAPIAEAALTGSTDVGRPSRLSQTGPIEVPMRKNGRILLPIALLLVAVPLAFWWWSTRNGAGDARPEPPSTTEATVVPPPPAPPVVAPAPPPQTTATTAPAPATEPAARDVRLRRGDERTGRTTTARAGSTDDENKPPDEEESAAAPERPTGPTIRVRGNDVDITTEDGTRVIVPREMLEQHR